MAIVTFDPIALRIVEVDTGGDNSLAVVDIYSAWKAWILADPSRLGYPAAFLEVGGDPISSVRSMGVTYFLLNGWKIRPAERDHQLILDGNLFTVPAGQRRVVSTLGSHVVEVEYSTSNLIDTIATGGGGGPTVQQIADAVWDEFYAGHVTPGTYGELFSVMPTDSLRIEELWSLRGLNIAGPLVVSSATVSAPGIQQKITDFLGTVILTRQP